MQYVRAHFGVLAGLLAVMVLVFGGLSPSPDALAQGDDTCRQMVDEALTTAQDACSELGRGEACFGHAGVAVTGEAALAATGDTASLATLESLTTTAAVKAGEWGMAMVSLPAGLPEDSDAAVTAVLYGDAAIARPAEAAAADRPTLKVWNGGGADVNLRNGAGITYELIGVLEPGEETIADGRNEQADWVRIQHGEGVAWVFSPLVQWEGDVNTLEVLLPTDVTPALAPSGAPFESFTLTAAPDTAMCGAASSGLLLQYSGEQAANLVVNQAGLEFIDATLLLHAAPDDALEVLVLTGSVSVTARGIPEDAEAGGAIQVSLGGEDGLTPTAPPIVQASYDFSNVVYAPLDLLAGELPCFVGVPAGNEEVILRVGPGEERGILASMQADASYAVLGWANAPDSAPWWELDTGQQTSWVAQSNVRAVGACDAVAQVEAPPVVVAPGAGAPPPADGGAAAGPDLAPTTNTVWQMRPGQDVMSGECSGAPAINFCDHLAAISPVPGGINWKGMEATPYTLSQTQPNVYYYSGPNALGTGTVTMTLTFTEEAALNMTMTLVLNNEPDCRHTYYYTGTRNW